VLHSSCLFISAYSIYKIISRNKIFEGSKLIDQECVLYHSPPKKNLANDDTPTVPSVVKWITRDYLEWINSSILVNLTYRINLKRPWSLTVVILLRIRELQLLLALTSHAFLRK